MVELIWIVIVFWRVKHAFTVAIFNEVFATLKLLQCEFLCVFWSVSWHAEISLSPTTTVCGIYGEWRKGRDALVGMVVRNCFCSSTEQFLWITQVWDMGQSFSARWTEVKHLGSCLLQNVINSKWRELPCLYHCKIVLCRETLNWLWTLKQFTFT